MLTRKKLSGYAYILVISSGCVSGARDVMCSEDSDLLDLWVVYRYKHMVITTRRNTVIVRSTAVTMLL